LKTTSFIFLILLFICACTKNKIVTHIKNKEQDSLKIYFDEANNYDLTLKKRENSINKALQIIQSQNNDSLQIDNLFKVANRFYNIENWDKYKKLTCLILKKTEVTNDLFSTAKACTYLGDYYLIDIKPDSSFYFYDKAEKIYSKINDKPSLGRTLLKKAVLQFNQSDFLGAEKAASRALKIVNYNFISDINYEAYNLLGQIYNELEDFPKSMEYHKMALSSIDDQIPVIFQSRATSYNNMGLVYLNQNKYHEAKIYFRKGLAEKNVLRDKASLYSILLNNLAYTKFKMNDDIGLPQMFYQALRIRDSLKITPGIIGSKLNLVEYYIYKKDTFKAKLLAKQVLNLAKINNSNRDLLLALKQLSIIEPRNATKYTREYIIVSEKLQKSDRAIGNKFSRIEYETEEVIEKNDYLTTKNRNLLYGLISFGVFGLLLYLIKNQKNRNKVLLYKQRQQKANEDIYNLMISQQSTIDLGRVKEKKRVAQELHDGVLGRIFGLRINLDTLNQFDDSNAIEKRNEYLLELRKIEQDLREISHDLSRENKELINNFVVILHNLLEEQRKTFSIPVQTSIDNSINWDEISNSIKINIYRIVQESLQNINKYAHANSIQVKCLKNGDQLILEIIDDGIGFNTIKAKKGIGLQNIRSRALDCNGTAIINSIISKGTHITITIHLV
jgi:signal transduction histidine kinase